MSEGRDDQEIHGGRHGDRHGALFETDANSVAGGMTQEPSELDRALNGLRVSEVPAGLQQRVLLGVQARMAQSQTVQTENKRREPGWGARIARSLCSLGMRSAGGVRNRDLLRRGWVAGGFVTATVAVTVVLVVSGTHHRARPVLRTRASAPDGKRLDRGSLATLAEGVALPAEQVAKSPRTTQVGLRKPAHAEATAAAAPFGEAHIGGMPAPPLPLTEQERLLLKLVRAQNEADMSGREASGQAVALELLNQKAQEEELARNDADFLKFFPPPLPVEDEREGVTAKDGKADGAGAEPAGKQGAGQTDSSGGKR